MKRLLPLLFVCVSALLSAQATVRYASVKVSLTGKTMDELVRVGVETEHALIYPGRSITLVLSELELEKVKQAGFATEVLIPDLTAHYLEQAQKAPEVQNRDGNCNLVVEESRFQTPSNYSYGTMGGYLTYAQILAELDKMHTLFPDLVSERKNVSETIQTWNGLQLQYVKISDNAAANEPEREVLYTALHHAREPNSASQMIFFMWYLLENYPSKPDIKALVDNLEMYFVPCVNPDGYVYNETNQPNGGGFWRKNRRDNGDGTFGVDLNRNYGYFWGDFGGSSGETSSEIYRGPDAFSEPETQSIRDFCLAHEFLFTLNYHTSGNLLIYPWAYSDSLADNAFVEYGKLFTRENDYHYGTTTETVGYNVNGSSDDWMYAEAGTYSFTPEVGTTGFWPVFNDIDKYNKDNMWQNLSMAYSALRYAEAKDLSDVQLTQTTGALDVELTRYGLLDGSITVTLTPISTNIISNASSHEFTSIGHLETQQTSFSYALDQQVAVGEEVVFLLETDNGFWIHTDTLKKRFQSGAAGPTVTLVSDALDATDNWVGDWQLTEDIYNSPTSCMTDSPFGENYQTSTSTYTQLVAPITIPANATDANLRFAARWDIEEDWDYVVVSAVELQPGGVTQPLCGLFTEPGNSNQLPEAPIYDGVQSDWVSECLSLKDFIGKTFIIRFQLVSDGFLEQDGFFFDDFKIDYNLPLSNTHHVAFNGIRLWQNEPNPAPEQTVIRWNLENQKTTEGLQLVMWDALGRLIFEKEVPAGDGSIKLDTRSMSQGVYHYAVKTVHGQSLPLKMIVIR